VTDVEEQSGVTTGVERGRRIKVTDKRRKGDPSGEKPEEVVSVVEGEVVENGSPDEAVRDYLDDLRRLQADFDNYRKRMMRDQAAVGERAKADLIGRLLPALDNFERAIEHAGSDSGLQMIYDELHSILKSEGLEEIPAKDRPFDPTVHEAVMSNDSDAVEEPTVSEVYRSGYSFKGSIVRPAMVVVARPTEQTANAEDAIETEAGGS
jgi:molecular chaperone GrpE